MEGYTIIVDYSISRHEGGMLAFLYRKSGITTSNAIFIDQGG